MKKFYHKKHIPQEEKPILKPLERSHTLFHALANDANSEWHELKSCKKSTDLTSNSSYRENFMSIGSDDGTPSLVIKDTDLASSWIYSRKKAAASSTFESVSSEPMSPAHTPCVAKQNSANDDIESSPQLEFKRIPIAPRMKAKSSCCCYMVVLLIVFICFLGILTSVGGILYLEIFSAERRSAVTIDSSSLPLTTTAVSSATQTENKLQTLAPTTENNDLSVVTEKEHSTSTPLRSTVTINMNLFQARRGNWGDDDDDELTESTLELTQNTSELTQNTSELTESTSELTESKSKSTTTDETDMFQDINKKLSTNSGNITTDRVEGFDTSINDRTTNAETKITIEKPSQITEHKPILVSGLSEKSTQTTAKVNLSTHSTVPKETNVINSTVVTSTRNFIKLSTMLPKHEDFDINSSVITKLKFSTLPEIHTAVSSIHNDDKKVSERRFTTSTSETSEKTVTLSDISKFSSKANGKDIDLQETNQKNKRRTTFVNAFSTLPHPTRKINNRLSDLQESFISVLKSLQQLDKRGILPNSRTKDTLISSKIPEIQQITRNAAASVLPALAETEREQYLDKLRNIYFNAPPS